MKQGKIETIILPANPILYHSAKLLDYILGREPTYGEVACYIAERLAVVGNVPVFTKQSLVQEVLSLDILDARFWELYQDTIYSFDLHGRNSSLELLAYEFGLVLLTPGDKHAARENIHITIPRILYFGKTTAFYPHRLDCFGWRETLGAVGF